MTTCVILQPSYIPWLGTFELAARADIYIHYDDVQYDKRGWRNRNRLRFKSGSDWITIPVSLPEGSHNTLIRHATITDDRWIDQHRRTVLRSLGEAQYFDVVREVVLPRLRPHRNLIDLTIPLFEILAEMLGVQTQFLRSSGLKGRGSRSERLVSLCRAVGADRYLSGPSAKSYLDEQQFEDSGIAVDWISYRMQPYPQLHEGFDPHVSSIDAIANVGPGRAGELVRATSVESRLGDGERTWPGHLDE